MNFIQQLSQLNPFVAGLFGTFASGIVLYLLRSVPLTIGQLIFKFCTTELTILSSDQVFISVDEWLNKQNFGNIVRLFKLSSKDGKLIPGFGSHIVRYKNKFLFINRSISQAVSAYGDRPEWISIRTFGYTHDTLKNIVAEICEKKDKLNAFVWNTTNSYWQKINEVHRKDLTKVFLPQPIKDKILSKITWFRNNFQWYQDKGIPYRLGCLFYGPPGTGKTSLITSIANKFKLPIYILNLKSLTGGDIELFKAVSFADSNTILLIEDIDAMHATDDRTKESTDKDKKTVSHVTLSGLLNAIDGITASEGRILCMTTNHIDKLDNALIRAARVDLTIKLDLMELEQVDELIINMFPKEEVIQKTFQEMARKIDKRSPAEWQAELIDYTISQDNKLVELNN